MVNGRRVWGAVVFGFVFNEFATRGIPVLDEYCENRHGAAWTAFKKRVQWKLIAGDLLME